MPEYYTTGEMAKAVGVTVRTIQYYDGRGLLIPSELTEGGRRLYSQQDLEKLKIICYLRDLDFSINQIKDLLAEEQAEAVLSTLIDTHIAFLEEELESQIDKLTQLKQLRKSFNNVPNFTMNHIPDISLTMKNQRAWRRLQVGQYVKILLLILIFTASILIAKELDSPWIAIVSSIVYLFGLLYLVKDGYKRIHYLCPVCHQTFQPSFKEFSLAMHTPKTRRLTCPHCHEKNYCIELAKEPVK